LAAGKHQLIVDKGRIQHDTRTTTAILCLIKLDRRTSLKDYFISFNIKFLRKIISDAFSFDGAKITIKARKNTTNWDT